MYPFHRSCAATLQPSQEMAARERDKDKESLVDELRLQDTGNLMKAIATNRDNVVASSEVMMNMMNGMEAQYDAMAVELAKEWADLGLSYDESNERVEIVAALKDGVSAYDPSMLGPALKSRDNESLCKEITHLLLRREQDFTEALVNVGRDDFLGEALENAHRNATLVGSVTAAAYTTLRDFFIALGSEVAARNVHHYKNFIRCFRSLCFLTRILDENLSGVEERMQHLEVLKDKYDATIFTLRRQLQDFHKENGTVGRGSNGEYQVFQPVVSPMHAAGSPHQFGAGAAAAQQDKHAIIIVQIESINHLRGRQQALYDACATTAKDIITGFANAFDLRRTNFTEQANTSKAKPMCFMFAGDEAYQALAFTTALHVELNRSTKWPAPLLQMSKYGGGEHGIWHGLRVRCGVHYGPVSAMDVPEATAVLHIEGVHVEKCMRIAALGVAGDTVVSGKLWEQYQSELTRGAVPTNRSYQSLRAMMMEELSCGKRRGFKKGEMCHRLWDAAVKSRRDEPLETDFEVISFFGLEAGEKEGAADDDPLTPEELLFAKETEISVLQQELDQLRLGLIKRESDWDEIKKQLLSSIEQIHRQTEVRVFYHEAQAASLEEQLMTANDILSQCAVVKLPVRIVHVPAADAAAVTTEADAAPAEPHDAPAELMDASEEELDTSVALLGVAIPTDEVSAAEPTERKQEVTPHRRATRVSITTKDDTEASVDEARRRKFSEWVQESSARSPGDDALAPLSGDPVSSPIKHKNVNLWRELNKLVNVATTRVASSTKQTTGGAPGAISSQGLKRIQSNLKHGTLPQVARIHSVLRVFTALVRRFIATDENTKDSDNQAITEDQFIMLFLKLVHPEGIVGNQREYIQLMANTAIDNETQEAANVDDDNRLVRSAGGQLAKMFLWLRGFKRKAALDANLSKKLQEELAAVAAAAKEKKTAAAAAAAKSKFASVSSNATLSASPAGASKSIGKKSPMATPLSSPQTDSLTPRPAGSAAPFSLGGGSDAVAEFLAVQKMKDEIASLKLELAKAKKNTVSPPQQPVITTTSVAVLQPHGTLPEAVSRSAAGIGAGGISLSCVDGGLMTWTAAGAPRSVGGRTSPTTALLVAEAAAFASTAGEPTAPPATIKFPGTEEGDAPPLFTLPSQAADDVRQSSFDRVPASLSSPAGDVAADDPSFESTAGSPVRRAASPAGAHASSFSVYAAASGSYATQTSHASRGSAVSPPRALSPPRASGGGLSGGLQGRGISATRYDGVGATAASGSALQLARAHRAAPFSADKQGLHLGGSAIRGLDADGFSVKGAMPAQSSAMSTFLQQANGAAPSLVGAGTDGLSGRALLPSRGPVLHPLRNMPGANVTSSAGRSVSPNPLQVEAGAVPGQQRVVATPTGMGAPSAAPSGNGGGKLFFALSGKDVQRQLEIEHEERRQLEQQQTRIQEQLIQLRQLQAENNALMARAGALQRQGTAQRNAPGQQVLVPLGISRMGMQGQTVNRATTAAASVKYAAAASGGPSIVVHASTTSPAPQQHNGMHVTDAALTIDVPSAQNAGAQNATQGGRSIAKIVAMHRRQV